MKDLCKETYRVTIGRYFGWLDTSQSFFIAGHTSSSYFLRPLYNWSFSISLDNWNLNNSLEPLFYQKYSPTETLNSINLISDHKSSHNIIIGVLIN